MMKDLFSMENKVAIVTGASSGIGRAIAMGFAEYGAHVVLVARSVEQLEVLKQEIETKFSVKVLVAPADVGVTSDVENVVAKTIEVFRRIDVLVNNAGVNLKKFFTDATEEDMFQIINTNLMGEFRFANRVAKQMIKQKAGKIINMASICSHMGLPNSSIYCASKGAIMQMTKGMAVDLGPYNINVNAISPGYVYTNFLPDLSAREGVMANVLKASPIKRICQAEDLVGAAIFLATEASSYCQGITIQVDGGMTTIAAQAVTGSD